MMTRSLPEDDLLVPFRGHRVISSQKLRVSGLSGTSPHNDIGDPGSGRQLEIFELDEDEARYRGDGKVAIVCPASIERFDRCVLRGNALDQDEEIVLCRLLVANRFLQRLDAMHDESEDLRRG
jgi:hypothetical protein